MTPFDELAAAIDAERAAWLAVKDHLPGTEGHDPRSWDAWLEAMRRCQEARAAAWGERHDEDGPEREPPSHGGGREMAPPSRWP
jgi:hypothetical protein